MTKRIGIAAVVLILATFAYAQKPQPVQPVTLFNRKLVSTTLQALGSGGIVTSCPNAGCSTSTPLFAPVNIGCPVPAGGTCTYFVQGSVPLAVGPASGEIGLVQFCGDGNKTCEPGSVSEIYSWTTGSSFSAYSFVIQATNTVANQKHRVEVAIGCMEAVGNFDGCFIEESADAVGNQYDTGPSQTINVYTP